MSETPKVAREPSMTSLISSEPDELFGGPDRRTDEERTNDYWSNLIDEVDDDVRVVVAGQHFVAHLFGSPGFGGEAYRVTWLDTERPEIVCSLSAQGDIPAAFRARLPDNATIRGLRFRGVGVIEAGIHLARLLDQRATW